MSEYQKKVQKKHHHKAEMQRRREEFKKHKDELLAQTSTGFNSFKQFVFAPYLLTFVISIVIGYAFSAVIKDLAAILSALIRYLSGWIFDMKGAHPLQPLLHNVANLFESTLTLAFISVTVYYTVKFINNYLTKEKDEQWGFDQQHEDALQEQALQKRTIELQEEILKRLEALENKSTASKAKDSQKVSSKEQSSQH
ncbi:MscL family protein [Leuconostocaceae bacterium ESL0958]|nr:MscL family protein [Leuconostocaceae bacterium ESL0958]